MTVNAIARGDAAPRTRALYQLALRQGRAAEKWHGRSVRGTWNPDPAISPAELAEAIYGAERSGLSTLIKRSDRSIVTRAPVLGRDALIKRYDLCGAADHLKYLARPSRGRRAWAASRTLAELAIPTPAALGLLEIYAGPLPVVSYFVQEFVTDAREARLWIKRHFSTQDTAFRAEFRTSLMNGVLHLYRNRVYHRDLKSRNMLLRSPTDPSNRAFLVVDLDAVRFGVAPNRRQIIRNLVQLNGSLGSRVSDEDRIAFLEELSTTYPWVTNARTVDRIRDGTRRRLERERKRICGP